MGRARRRKRRGAPPPPPRRRKRRYTRRRRRTPYRRAAVFRFTPLITVCMVLLLFIAGLAVFLSKKSNVTPKSSAPKSTINREKLDSGLPFDSNCIIDELDWFDSIPKAGASLKTFYNMTGVQPYIVLLRHHPELTTDSEKEKYAQEYYASHIDNEATFLYVYFAEQDQDKDVGYMCHVNGKQVNAVMDAEAVDIFWNYLDEDWYSDMSTDTLFENAFIKTANTIMEKSK